MIQIYRCTRYLLGVHSIVPRLPLVCMGQRPLGTRVMDVSGCLAAPPAWCVPILFLAAAAAAATAPGAAAAAAERFR